MSDTIMNGINTCHGGLPSSVINATPQRNTPTTMSALPAKRAV